jgi:hypothetical protein
VSSPAEPNDRARAQRLASLISKLAPTAVGRAFGLTRIRSPDDLRASVPLLDEESHLREVETHLGFGVVEPGDPQAEALVGGAAEREELLTIWKRRLGEPARRVAVLRSVADDALIDRIVLDDVTALVEGEDAELLRLKEANSPQRVIEILREFRPDALVLPSLTTCSWLEAQLRCPIERGLESLRWLLPEHDLGARVRSRLPRINTGWVHRSGRLALPSGQAQASALCLATRSVLLELLSHEESHERGRARVGHPVWPEDARIGSVYELVVSSPAGFLRLRTGEFVRVVGFDGPHAGSVLPRPRVVRRLPPPADVEVEGMTLPGAWLTASVRQAFGPADPALVAAEIGPDPETIAADVASTASRAIGDPFADTELGSRVRLRRAGRRPRGLAVRVEVQSVVDGGFAPRLATRIDADLQRRSEAYRYLRGDDQLLAPRVLVAPMGTARGARDRRVAQLSGRVIVPEVRVVFPD